MKTAIILIAISLILSSCETASPGATVAPPSGGPTTQLTVTGQPVIGGADLLDVIATNSRDRNMDGFACYFSTLDGQSLNPFVRCGPAHPNLKGEQGPWETVTILATVGPEGVRLRSGMRHGTGYNLLADEVLSRPDGATPPPIDEIQIPPVTGRVFETVWDSLGYDLHYCMADQGAFVFAAEFTFDGKLSVDFEEVNQVEVVRLTGYETASFDASEPMIGALARCVDTVAMAAGASFGEVAE